jgi:hypothetical protein
MEGRLCSSITNLDIDAACRFVLFVWQIVRIAKD